jgi:hypothetical protein
MKKELIVWGERGRILRLGYRTEGGTGTERGFLYYDAEGNLTGNGKKTLTDYLKKGYGIKIHDENFPEKVRTKINELKKGVKKRAASVK